MEISNLPDAEFKTLVIRMLKELTGYFNSIKKTQAEMKITLNEIKKNLQGTNSGGDEAEKHPIQKNLCTPMLIEAQFTIAKCWKQPKCPSVNEWIK